MATSIRQFNVELYREHLDDASFLYDQRQAYLRDPEVDWPKLRDWEERFEAHIDALVVGGELALEVCRAQAAEGDAGQRHAAVRVFCRQKRKDDLFGALRGIDPENGAAARAVAEALRWELPREWRDELLALGSGHAHLVPVLAQLIGNRRFSREDVLTAALGATPRVGSADIAWALGRVGSGAAASALWPMLDSEDNRVCEVAAIALMRLGDERPVQRALQDAHAHAWARRVLGIGGNARAVRVLLDAVDSGGPVADAILALGLLGDLSAVAPLVALLDDDDLAAPASVALNAITGAQLHAMVFVPDKVDPDELTDEERAAFEKDGKVPMREGRPFGNYERHPLRDKAGWRQWLDREKSRFSREHRWRMGKPYGPAALVECLKCATTPFAVRAATYEELVIRYRLDVPFEADLPVRHQARFLAKMDEWVGAHSKAFVDGGYYFAGRLQ